MEKLKVDTKECPGQGKGVRGGEGVLRKIMSQ